MAANLIIALIGVTTVFFLLLILVAAVGIMGVFFKQKPVSHAPAEEIKPQVAKITEAEKSDDGEILAVITAAVAACMGSGFRVSSVVESNYVVRSLRVGESSNSWSQYARANNVR